MRKDYKKPPYMYTFIIQHRNAQDDDNQLQDHHNTYLYLIWKLKILPKWKIYSGKYGIMACQSSLIWPIKGSKLIQLVNIVEEMRKTPTTYLDTVQWKALPGIF